MNKIKSIKKINLQPLYDITVEKDNSYTLANGVKSHNTGSYYSANNIFIMGRQQEKDSKDLVGYNFILNAEKSRFVKEKSKFELKITFEDGLNKYSGLLPLAIEGGFVDNSSKGWYSYIDQETGEVTGNKLRERDTYTEEFWKPILENPLFDKFIRGKYQL